MDITEVLDPPQRGFQELGVPQGASAVAVATASPSLPAIDRPSRNDFENETLAQQRASTLRLCEETVALLALPVWSSFGCATPLCTDHGNAPGYNGVPITSNCISQRSG